MSKHLLVKIPTKPHLKKYVVHELNNDLLTPGAHPIHKFLYIMLEKKFYRYNFKSFEHSYKETVDFTISKYTFTNVGYSISQQNIVIFNDYIEQLFDRELYRFCRDYEKYAEFNRDAFVAFTTHYSIPVRTDERDKHKKTFLKKPTLKEILENFALKMNLEIDKDISFDSLKKMEYRARKRIEKNEKNIFLRCVPKINTAALTLDFVN